MNTTVLLGILIPFAGTSLGAAMVFALRKSISESLQKILTGFAAGVMVAAAVWGLIIPSMEQAAGMGSMSFLPALIGLWLGFGFLMLLDKVVPHLHQNAACREGMPCKLRRTSMMVLAVALHNLPEGMAVGAVLAGMLAGDAGISAAAAVTLSLGIAIQNFPEGAIISIPLKEEGMPRWRAFLMGALSGVVEPLGALLTLLAAGAILPALPYLLAFFAMFNVGLQSEGDIASLVRSSMTILGFFAGAAAWWVGLTFTIDYFRRRFRPRHMLTINHVAGVIIGVLGVYTIISTFFDILPK